MKFATSPYIALLTLVTAALAPHAQTPPPKPVVIDSSQQIASRIISSKRPVLIDFWAPWCGPCRILNPIIKEIEKEFSGKVEVVKVNIDIHRVLANHFRVTSIPHVFIVKDKQVMNSLSGVRSKEDYRLAVMAVLNSPPADSARTPPVPRPAPSKSPADTL